jgi:hypothetical protein
MEDLKGCQIHCLPQIAEGRVYGDSLTLKNRIKRLLAKPWNYTVKNWLKRISARVTKPSNAQIAVKAPTAILAAGDLVRVRSKEEIAGTLDRWNELKGCAFLEDMWQYCGTEQAVLQPLERFLDERDYKVKKCKGIVLLKDVQCIGTPVFGRCDRKCYLFWRVEWLEKIN